jgi:hypothetical protein
MFAAILMWEELWALADNGSLSASLLVLITAGAVACSVAFEKRMWCRHLCPIGAMNGLYRFARLLLLVPPVFDAESPCRHTVAFFTPQSPHKFACAGFLFWWPDGSFYVSHY